MAKKVDNMKDKIINNFQGIISRLESTSPTTETRDVLHSSITVMLFDDR